MYLLYASKEVLILRINFVIVICHCHCHCQMGAFIHYYNSVCYDWMLSHPGRAITIYDICSLNAQAYHKAFIPTTIIAGFNHTKIYHMNWYIFSDDVFLSSALTEVPEHDVSQSPRPVYSHSYHHMHPRVNA